ncbi:DUF3089 domain-containing protein [Neotamlana sedimentorum]|uniref:DUF3089 domain-containing protein n=1 Tax=Neotamlana sedimentorum TaxID=1435349 RepID=UPI00069C112D|nr:DUF3089 domain-containing protein [Tamlana sedimentorum]
MKKLLLLALIILQTACSKSDNGGTEEEQEDDDDPVTEVIDIPTSTVDFENTENWVIHPEKTTLLPFYNLDIALIDENLNIEETIAVENNATVNTGVDVFWVHPTILTTAQSAFTPQNIPIDQQDKLLINLTIIAQGGLLAKYGRVFAPHYRQSSGKTYDETTDKEEQANIIATSYSDVKAAFLEYLNNYNNGNKIIIAGHSQGSYLLGMLLRDVFDENPTLRDQLVVAALAGMAYVYAEEGQYKGGWWENIPLCTTTNECGCISNWAAFDEAQDIPDINPGLPEFNPYLINSGLVYRAFNETEDWFVQDFSYYGETATNLDYYITPDSSYDYAEEANFIAFNNFYTARQRREANQKVVLSINFEAQPNDQRPNELEDEQDHINYSNWGYHTKDYHIYLWALMSQIDEKLEHCN